ncbi:MAG TPA: Rieske 2Fe-2S domain-containing protein [Anaerolineales bacterium]|nr:Rieske 2Fe-2S domain-containing protein [Anaerolineales bacterium]
MDRVSNPDHINRRDFVKIVTTFLGSTMAVILGLPGIAYLTSPALRISREADWISLGSLENYTPGLPARFNFTRARVNGWEKTVSSYGVYVLRKEAGQVKVFSDICTHLGCRVTWHPEIQEYVSPCHDGHFDIDGVVTKGPPPRPLDQYEVKIDQTGDLYIHLLA